MAEYIASQGGHLLNIEAKYYNKLDIEGFSQMMKNPSYSYKFYWLEAVVHIISEGKNETTLEEIIDEMIANAWYSVREFHIHLSGIQADGLIRDGLERAILQLTELSDLPAAYMYETERKTKNLSVNKDVCVGCGVCAKKCPVGAIQMKEGRPVWKSEECEMCLGCLHRCPKFAISYGNGKTDRHGQYKNPYTRI